jgi:hypothetical protein
MATTWSASVACHIPRKKPRNRKDRTFRPIPVITLAPRGLSRPYYAAFRAIANSDLRVPPQHGWAAGPISRPTLLGTMFASAGRNPSALGAPIERSDTIYLEIRSRTGSFDSRGPRHLREYFPAGRSGQRAARPEAVIGCRRAMLRRRSGREAQPAAVNRRIFLLADNSQTQTKNFHSTGLLVAAGRRPVCR